MGTGEARCPWVGSKPVYLLSTAGKSSHNAPPILIYHHRWSIPGEETEREDPPRPQALLPALGSTSGCRGVMMPGLQVLVLRWEAVHQGRLRESSSLRQHPTHSRRPWPTQPVGV